MTQTTDPREEVMERLAKAEKLLKDLYSQLPGNGEDGLAESIREAEDNVRRLQGDLALAPK